MTPSNSEIEFGAAGSDFSCAAGLTRDDWTVCTFGNLSSLVVSYQLLQINALELLAIRAEGRFDGRELPVLYGYATDRGRGIALAAWRRGFGDAGLAAAPGECIASAALTRRVRPEDLPAPGVPNGHGFVYV